MRRKNRHTDGCFLLRRFEIQTRATGFNPLHHHHICSGGAQHLGFAKGRCRAHPGDAGLLETIVVLFAQTAEGDAHKRHSFLQEHIKLRVKVGQRFECARFKPKVSGQIFER